MKSKEETESLLSIVLGMTTFGNRDSAQAMALKTEVWHEVLQFVPFEFAKKYVIEQARKGTQTFSPAPIAQAWTESRTAQLRDALNELTPPDSLSEVQQRLWLRHARQAFMLSAPVEKAREYADQQLRVDRRELTSTVSSVPQEQSQAKLKTLLAQWGHKARLQASERMQQQEEGEHGGR